MMTEERKQFEAWAKMFGGKPDLTKANGGANYSDSIIDIAWLAWRASRAAQPASPALKLPDEKQATDDRIDYPFDNGWNACIAEVKRLNAPHTAQIEPICATGGADWVKCIDRMPAIKDGSWRTPLPVLVSCELGVIPAYARTYTTIGGEKKVGFMASLTLGNGRGKHPESLYSSEVLTQVTMWRDMPAAPEE